MANQDLFSPDSVQPSTEEESLTGPPIRHDTMSTVSSDKARSLPAGMWSIRIHGNCSRCHHHHKNALFPIKVRDGSREGHDIYCQKCKLKWLTIDQGNSTQLSLLSTRTTTISSEKEVLRHRLIEVVRCAMAATTIASPTLASVPESSSRVPSRGNSVHPPHQESTRSVTESSAAYGSPQETRSIRGSSRGNMRQDHVTERVTFSKKARKTFEDVKRKLEHVWKKVHVRKKRTERTLPNTGRLGIQDPSTIEGGENPSRGKQSRDKDHESTTNTQDKCRPSRTLSEALDEIDKFDRDKIKRMNTDERCAWVRKESADWIREHITNFTCRCSRHCSCKYKKPTLPPITDVLRGIGGHFNSSQAGSQSTGVLTLNEITSDDTVVGSHSVASSTTLNGTQYSRRRSLSPRRASLATSRHSQHLLPHDLVQRNSMDSIITNAAVRGSPRGGRRAADRRSVASLAPPPSSSRPVSPEARSQINRTTLDGDSSTHTIRAHSAASASRVNVYPTDDERNQESDATSPVDTPNS